MSWYCVRLVGRFRRGRQGIQRRHSAETGSCRISHCSRPCLLAARRPRQGHCRSQRGNPSQPARGVSLRRAGGGLAEGAGILQALADSSEARLDPLEPSYYPNRPNAYARWASGLRLKPTVTRPIGLHKGTRR